MENEMLTMTHEELSTDTAPAAEIENFKNGSVNFYCSLQPKTRQDKIVAYNAINGTDTMLIDHTKEVLEVVDIAAYPVKVLDGETGEVLSCMSCVLICNDGKCYRATSLGVASSLQKIFAVVGMPDGGAWHKEPLKVKAVQKNTRSGFKTLVLELVQ